MWEWKWIQTWFTMRHVFIPLTFHFPCPSDLADGLKVRVASSRMDMSARAPAFSATGILASISLNAFCLFFSVDTNPGGNGSFPFLRPPSFLKMLRISSFDNTVGGRRCFFCFPSAPGACSVSGSVSLALLFRTPFFKSN